MTGYNEKASTHSGRYSPWRLLNLLGVRRYCSPYILGKLYTSPWYGGKQAFRGTSTNSSKWSTENGNRTYWYRRWEQQYLAVCTTLGHGTDFIWLPLPVVHEVTCRNTFLHSKSPKIIVVSHTDTMYDGHCVLLWTHAFHESYKSTEKLRIWPVFHILPAKNKIHILFFSPGTTYWDYCCTTKKPVTETAGSTLFSKSLFKLKSFFLTHLWTLLTTNCS